MKNTIKSIITFADRSIHDWRLDHHFRAELEEIKKKTAVDITPLSMLQKKEIQDYYLSLGFGKVDTRWHEFLYAVTGKEDVRFLPENFYHLVIEPLYTRGSTGWEDKAYMNMFLPGVVFPQNIVRNVHGYFLDNDGEFVSKDKAISMIKNEEKVVIKPTRASGGGRGVALIQGKEFGDAIISEYGMDFVLQKPIEQHPLMARFNTSSVNTEKIISFLYKGQVYILTSILRIGAPGAITDTASTGKGFTVGIQKNGHLNDTAFNIYGKRKDTVCDGVYFRDVTLPAHLEICQIIEKAHKKMPYFGLISWDFAVDVSGQPILIEYNLNYPDVMIYQMNNGPLFGEHTDEWLKDIAELNKRRRK